MWQKLINLISSLRSYDSLSPDIRVRQQVNQMLKTRPALTLNDWVELFQGEVSPTPSKSVIEFVYTSMQTYAGLEFGRVRPLDHIHHDLHLPLICWFDWPLQFCDDFCTTFGIDISDCFDEGEIATVQDLICFLNDQLNPVDSVSS